MRKLPVTIILSLFFVFLLLGCQNEPEATSSAKEKAGSAQSEKSESAPQDEQTGPSGCDPEFRALFDHAKVELAGKGDLEVLVVTDPLCWHCRLGHNLLSEYPDKYGKLKILFFPRRSFIGSDMAAWILEDVAGTDKLKAYIDFAYSDLKQPKTADLMNARMLVLLQFTQEFPELLDGTTMEELYARLQKDHEAHVLAGAELAKQANLPGTPILVAGKVILMGFGPEPWLKAMDDKRVCE